MREQCDDCEIVLDIYDKCRCERRLKLNGKILCFSCYHQYAVYNGAYCECYKK